MAKIKNTVQTIKDKTLQLSSRAQEVTSQAGQDIKARPGNYVFILIVGLLFAYGAFKLERVFHKERTESIYSTLSAVNYITELRLAKFYYEAIIPVYKWTNKMDKAQAKGKEVDPKRGDLQFILVAPVEVGGFIDLSKVQYEDIGDSTILVTMPSPELTEPVVRLDSIKDYAIKNKGFALQIRTRAGGLFYKAFTSMQHSIIQTKATVSQKAVASGLLTRTEKMGEIYMRNLLESLGYKAEFTLPNAEDNLRTKVLNSLLKTDTLDRMPLDKKLDLLKELKGINSDNPLPKLKKADLLKLLLK